jgi:deoxyribodipyrimidine photo-lyase
MQYLVDGDLVIDHWQWQMQAGITNPLSDTFRIYNPNKNIEDRDKDLQFIYHWVPELHGYSLLEILKGVYLGESPLFCTSIRLGADKKNQRLDRL